MDRTYMNLQVENTHVCAWECMSKVQEKPGNGVLQFRDFVTRTKGKKKKKSYFRYFLTFIIWLEFCIILIKKKPLNDGPYKIGNIKGTGDSSVVSDVQAWKPELALWHACRIPDIVITPVIPALEGSLGLLACQSSQPEGFSFSQRTCLGKTNPKYGEQ